MNTLEVCCGNIESVRAAIEGGADRIELCRDLEHDGLTPDIEVVRQAVELCHPAGVKVHVLIRSREGSFVYTQDEVDTMTQQISDICRCGADGIVIGALTKDGDIDIEACQRWVEASNSSLITHHSSLDAFGITFHRAFDVCRNPFDAIEQIIRLGCNRILSSGQAQTAEAGIPMLKRLVEQSAGRITILCGAGVNENNAHRILTQTGATEIHGSLRTGLVTDARKVAMVKHHISPKNSKSEKSEKKNHNTRLDLK